MKRAFEIGYSQLTHIMNDDDVDLIKGRIDFKNLMAEYEGKLAGRLVSLNKNDLMHKASYWEI